LEGLDGLLDTVDHEQFDRALAIFYSETTTKPCNPIRKKRDSIARWLDCHRRNVLQFTEPGLAPSGVIDPVGREDDSSVGEEQPAPDLAKCALLPVGVASPSNSFTRR